MLSNFVQVGLFMLYACYIPLTCFSKNKVPKSQKPFFPQLFIIMTRLFISPKQQNSTKEEDFGLLYTVVISYGLFLDSNWKYGYHYHFIIDINKTMCLTHVPRIWLCLYKKKIWGPYSFNILGWVDWLPPCMTEFVWNAFPLSSSSSV